MVKRLGSRQSINSEELRFMDHLLMIQQNGAFDLTTSHSIKYCLRMNILINGSLQARTKFFQNLQSLHTMVFKERGWDQVRTCQQVLWVQVFSTTGSLLHKIRIFLLRVGLKAPQQYTQEILQQGIESLHMKLCLFLLEKLHQQNFKTVSQLLLILFYHAKLPWLQFPQIRQNQSIMKHKI